MLLNENRLECCVVIAWYNVAYMNKTQKVFPDPIKIYKPIRVFFRYLRFDIFNYYDLLLL